MKTPSSARLVGRLAASGLAVLTASVWLALPTQAEAAGDLVRTTRGMVVSSQRLASEIGADVLREGGNAVDAAVATGLALAVVHPSAGNLGGGGFMLVFTKSGEVTAFDFRETAPLAARADMFLGPNGKYRKDSNHDGYRAVGVPGTVAGFDLALNRFGSRSWKELAAPAVLLAEDGFPLTDAMANEFRKRKKEWLKFPSSAKVFLRPDRSAFRSGDIWRQPDLARTLRRLQEHGREEFYFGETARRLAADMKAHGGLITEADLAAYTAKERPPVRGTYRGCEVYSMPPPSSGGVALVEMLNLLEGYDLKSLGHNSAPYLHRLAEAMRRAYADRARFLGDPDFNPDLPLARLTSKEYAARLRKSIRLDRASPSDPARFGNIYESEETTHYSVVDAEGNAVAVTYTLEYSYGSRIVADGLGFLYNNEMGDFNPQPGRTDRRGFIGTPPNVIAPGKRMLSSMTPTILARDGKPLLVIGSPGGRTIINTVLQVVLNVVDFEMGLANAIGARRVHHQWLPDEIVSEPEALLPATRRQLKGMGHTVRVGGKIGQAMGVFIDPTTGQRLGAADPRAPDGSAAGH
ncbi:MAG: gamma-glutamyltransferase [Verrucomicrobia bacterium]|nr:gamma-glutamyltransferase [Verrucomicrobiota bacterium]